MGRIRGPSGLWAAVATAATLVALPAADAATRKVSPAHLFLFPGRGGAVTVWTSANDAGQAVGQKVRGTVSDLTWFNGSHGRDVSSRLGHGAFASIDQLGWAAGTTSDGFPLYFDPQTNKRVTLADHGRATGNALGPLVAVTLSDGMAELWNPDSGATLPLGDASTTGVNAWGTVVGSSHGDLWYSVPNGQGGAQQHTLSVPGNFDHVNELNVATGYERLTSGGLTPITYNIGTGKLTKYELPRGEKYGVVTGENDSGTIAYGNAFRNLRALESSKSIGVTWRAPRRPMEIPYHSFLRSYPFSGQSAVSAVSDSAIAVGEVTIGKNEVADILGPRTDEKLVGLKRLVTRAKWVDDETRGDVYGRLFKIQRLVGVGENEAACRRINELGSDLDKEATFLEHQFSFFAVSYLALYDDLDGGLWELARELGCPGTLDSKLEGLLRAPQPSQSPYAGTSLAWQSPTY